jgi:tripartite-type tricarboxylate transporter receptor subunit TctC
LAPAAAENFPTRPIHVVVPAPAGGPLDYRIRLIADKLSPTLGQPIIIDNRPGAAGVLAAGLVAQAKPDGYTLLYGHSGTHSFAPHIQGKLPYDPVRDFETVALVGLAPHFLYVRDDSPFRSVKDLLTAAKSKPGALTYGSGGVGSPQHIETELFKHMSGIELVHVAYKGSAPLMTDLLGGQISVALDAFVPGMEYVKAGRMRVLATTRARRCSTLPELPTIAESGVPGYEMRIWFGILAPRGTPREIVARLNKEFVRVLATPEMSKDMKSMCVETEPLTPDQFGALVREELVTGKKLVEISGARQE